MHGLLIWISFIAIISLSGTNGSSVLIADNSMSNMIEVTSRSPFCHIHRDRGVIRAKLLASDQRRVRQMTDESISKLMAICNDKFVHSAHQGGFIYPGTKWCGPGNKAQNYSDIGQHIKEDKCCREHDFCDKYLEPGNCERGICNKSPFTRSHCDCDSKFRRCLQNVNTETANTIGAIFFNVIQIVCFRERTPCAAIHGYNTKYTHNNYCPLRYYKSPKFPVDFKQFIPFSLLKYKKVPEFVDVIFKKLKIF